MIRLRLKNKRQPEDDFLSLPESEPVTLHEIDSSNLPYACQCPLCGGIFEIPTGVLYELVEDNYEDKESNLETIGPSSMSTGSPSKPPGNDGFFDDSEIESSTVASEQNTPTSEE